MCLGVPGKIVDIYLSAGMRMGKMDFGGVLRDACLEALPEAQVGDYAIIHAGFAITQLSEDEANLTLEALRELSRFEAEEETLTATGISPDASGFITQA